MAEVPALQWLVVLVDTCGWIVGGGEDPTRSRGVANRLERFGHSFGVVADGPSHLVSGMGGAVSDLDAASAVRPITGPIQ